MRQEHIGAEDTQVIEIFHRTLAVGLLIHTDRTGPVGLM
jgi:hypothetical protein